MRINRPASLFVSIALLASVVVGYSTTASAAPATPPVQAVGYWTESAMASALPVEVVVDSKTGQGRLRVIEQGKVTSGTPSTQKAFDWPTNFPIAQTAVGKVFFSVGRSNYVCSGALVTENDPNRAIVLTAAHCVWNQGTRGAWVSNWAFVPNYDGGERTKWYSKELVARSEFTSQRSFNNTALAYDWAFAVLRTGGNNGNLLPDVNYQLPGAGTIVKNSYDLNIDGFTVNSTSFAFGYPAAAPYDGLTLKYASGSIFLDPNTPSTTWGMISDLTGGASGGPWLSGLTDGVTDNLSGKLSSVNSYKYSVDITKMYGPRFNIKTQSTFDVALSTISSAGNRVVTG